MTARFIRNVLIAAGVMNIAGVVVFSRFFTNDAINTADPVVMSNFGLLMIVVWGLAYLGASVIVSNVRWLIGAFALEKLVYVVAWVHWHTANSISQLTANDLFAGIFFSIYGLNDFVFMILFLLIAWQASSTCTRSGTDTR